MSALLLPIPQFAGHGFPADWPSRILVAADGRDSSNAAIVMAWALGHRTVLDVVSVLKAESRETVSPAARGARAAGVAAQLSRVLGMVPAGDIAVECGSPADVIATCARVRGASLLVIGLGTEPVHDRLLGDEMALAIARRTSTPLFAVAGHQLDRPRRIVVGMDFSAASFAACETALDIAGDGALVALVHVNDQRTRNTPSGALWRLVDRVQTGFTGRVTAVERNGDPASQLLDVAAAVRADTIAIGGHGQTAAKESALGPVATRVMRCSPGSVLLVPAFEEC